MGCKFIVGLPIFLFGMAISVFACEGDTLWTRLYDGGFNETARCVIQTADGGYLAAGSSYPDVIWWKDAWLVKTDYQGDVIWDETYGPNNANEAHSVIETPEGDFLFVGETSPSIYGSSDVYLAKVSATGEELWTRVYGGTGTDGGYDLTATSDGGYLVAGDALYSGPDWIDNHVLLVKVNNDGDTLWIREYSEAEDIGANAVLENDEGDYLVAGWTGDLYNQLRTMYLMKTDSSGDVLWSHAYWSFAWAAEIIQTSDGGYLLAGTVETGGGGLNMYAQKVDRDGNPLWAEFYYTSFHDRISDVIQTQDGGYLFAGATGHFDEGEVNLCVVRADSAGNELWKITYEDSSGSDLNSVILTADDDYILAGNFWSPGMSDRDAYLVCMEGYGTSAVSPGLTNPTPKLMNLSAYPNPFNPTTTITFEIPLAGEVELRVFDIQGQDVTSHQLPAASGYYSPGLHHITFDGLNLASGIYFVRLQAGKFLQTQKLVLLK